MRKIKVKKKVKKKVKVEINIELKIKYQIELQLINPIYAQEFYWYWIIALRIELK